MTGGSRPVRGRHGGEGRSSGSDDWSEGRETVRRRRRRPRDWTSSSGEESASNRRDGSRGTWSRAGRREHTRIRRGRGPTRSSLSDGSRDSSGSPSASPGHSASELEPTRTVWLPGMPQGGPRPPQPPPSPTPDFGVTVRYSRSQRAYFAERSDTPAHRPPPGGDVAPPTSLWSEDESRDRPGSESERSRVVGHKSPLPPFATPPQSPDGVGGGRMRRDAASPYGIPLSPLAVRRGGHMACGAGAIPTATAARWGAEEDAEVFWRPCGQSTAWRSRLQQPWKGAPASAGRGRGRRGDTSSSGSDRSPASRPATPVRRSRGAEDAKRSERGRHPRPRHRRRGLSRSGDSGSSSSSSSGGGGRGGEVKRDPLRARRRQRREFVRYRTASHGSPTGLTSASEAELDVGKTYAVDRHAAEGARHRRVRRATRQAYVGGRPPTRLYGSGSEDEGGSTGGRGGERAWVPTQPRVLTSSRSRDARRVPRSSSTEVYRV